MRHHIVSDHGEAKSVTVYIKGRRPLVAGKEHPNFGAILDALRAGEDDPKKIQALFDMSQPIKKGFRKALKKLAMNLGLAADDRVTDKVEVKDGRVYHDGEEVDGVITDVILQYYNEGNEDFVPLVRFLENLKKNPNPHSREHLYRWVERRHLTITEDGCFLAYKGVSRLGDKGTHAYGSVTSGSDKVTVDGRTFTGRIPQSIGSLIEMAREDVTFDPGQHCSRGLHVGTWSYARSWGTVRLLVKVNPADVVSVPNDSSSQKLRTCAYEVLSETTSENKAKLHAGASS